MRRDLRGELKGLIQEDKIGLVTRSFDIIGSKQKAVAVVEVPEELREFEGAIARAVMKVNKNVASVLVKESCRTGEYRTRELRLVEGDMDTEVLHREAGCVYRLDPRTVYFSPRESSERERLSSAVRDGEDVLVMFSGVGPIPISIAKRRRNVHITAVELNPYAHNYCVENIHLNRVADGIEVIWGDVREVGPGLERLYDRIMMPMPRGAHRFLDVAVPLLKDGGVLHLYHWAPDKDLFSEAEQLIAKAVEAEGKNAEFVGRVKVSQYSPRTWKIRVDTRISTA
jgi:tRNA (guanine37-N1)-methyltransferase